MRLLIDTQLLIWSAEGEEHVPRRARDAIRGAELRAFSVASLWEVAVKHARRKPDFDLHPALLHEGLLGNDYAELPVDGRHVLAVADLPAVHGDLFDRLLMAQARVEGLTLLTANRTLAAYGSLVSLV